MRKYAANIQPVAGWETYCLYNLEVRFQHLRLPRLSSCVQCANEPLGESS